MKTQHRNPLPAKRNRIVFVVLAHERADILTEQIRNIRHFNPDSAIMLYNSSGDPAFGQGIEQLMVCPYSRGPLAWGRTGRVLYDAMRWLRETSADYDYLVYIDSDVIFLRPGLEAYLDETMQGFECMGVDMHVEHGPGNWIPGQTMWREWGMWRELFQIDYLAGMFANGQVFRRELVNRMYDRIDTARLEMLFHTTNVVALEEILSATLAVRSGGVYRTMPEPAARYIRYEPPLSLEEIKASAQTEGVYFVHPVLRDWSDPARSWSVSEPPVVPTARGHSISLNSGSPVGRRKRRKVIRKYRNRRFSQKRGGTWVKVKKIHRSRKAALTRRRRKAGRVRKTKRSTGFKPKTGKRKKKKRIARKGSHRKRRVHPHTQPGNAVAPFQEKEKEKSDYSTPKDYYRSTMDWIASQPTPPLYKEIYGGHKLDLKPPQGIDEPIHVSFQLPSFYSPPPYVVEIPNGRAWGDFGSVIAPDNKLLYDVSIFPPFIPGEHPVFLQTEMPPVRQTHETVAVLTFCASSMYYHWMFDVLSRIDLLNKSGIPIDKYIVNGVRSAFQWETLDALGIPRDKLIHCDGTFYLEAKRLVVPVAAAIEWGPHYWQIQYLRQELLTKRGLGLNPEYERIYISRSKAAHRKVVNEDQVLELLVPLGFKIIHLESYSVLQQAEILSSAQTVVAPHGSGLTNLIFCRPGTKVVELFTSNFPVYVNWLTGNQLNLDYYCLLGEGERADDKIDPRHGFEDMVIDTKKLVKLLRMAGIYTG